MEDYEQMSEKKTCIDCETEDCPAKASGFRCPERGLAPEVIEAISVMFSQKFKTKVINGEYLNEQPRLGKYPT